ncbi:MAG: replication-associated recombination protein A, partial [Clostridia bacterium]|nr:replication-associated recombination protein A [Clostridia bacterium]
HKSNSVVVARDNAMSAVNDNGDYYVPLHLRNTDFSTMDKATTPYLYPHDFGGYIKQQYLPDSLAETKFYFPTSNGDEQKIKEFLRKLDELYRKG